MADRITVLDKGKLEQVDLTNESLTVASKF